MENNKINLAAGEVTIIASGIKKYGYDDLREIEEYPRLSVYKRNASGSFIYKTTDDWPVIETPEMSLFMNNEFGYIVIVEFEAHHYEEGRGLVVDRPGHIYFTEF